MQANSVDAEKLFMGAKVTLLVDPSRALEGRRRPSGCAGRVGLVWLGSLIVGLGLLLGGGLVAFELRRAIRREVAPLRLGALVWLTADEPLPDTKEELRFAAHYFRDDVKQSVTARGAPGETAGAQRGEGAGGRGAQRADLGAGGGRGSGASARLVPLSLAEGEATQQLSRARSSRRPSRRTSRADAR